MRTTSLMAPVVALAVVAASVVGLLPPSVASPGVASSIAASPAVPSRVNGSAPSGAESAAAASQDVDESLRLLFARAESMFRAGEQSVAVRLLDRLVDALIDVPRPLDEEGRLLLTRSLLYRVRANWQLEERDLVDDDLERLIELAPDLALDAASIPKGILSRFERLRTRHVGYLRIAAFPMNAEVRVDGRLIDPLPEVLPVRAGDRTITVERSGHAPKSEEVSVRADRTADIGLTLERTSAVINLMTRPAGATVVIDGDRVGRTLLSTDDAIGLLSGTDPEPGVETATVSRQLVVEGLLPGLHEIEIALEGYRTFRSRLEIPGLADYDLGTVALERSIGRVLLQRLPAGAEVLVDGQLVVPERPEAGAGDSGPAQLILPLGDHQLFVSHPVAGIWEGRVLLGEGESAALDVRLRPGLVLLAMLGEDTLAAEAVQGELSGHLSSLDRWFYLDRTLPGSVLLEEVGVTTQTLRMLADGAAPATVVDWAALRAHIEDRIPASLFIVAVLSADRLADHADLWIWSASPAPPVPERVRLPVNDNARMEELVRQLREPLSAERSWLGARLIDSDLAAGAVVLSVSPGSPAMQAGLQPGDEIISVAGDKVDGVASVQARVEGLQPFSNQAVEVVRSGSSRILTLTLGSSPQLVDPRRGDHLEPVLMASMQAELHRQGSAIPRWVLQLNMGMIHLLRGQPSRSIELLESIQAPADLPMGKGTADYVLGMALAASNAPARAREAFARALESPDARLWHHDGPLVGSLVRARLRVMDAGAQP